MSSSIPVEDLVSGSEQAWDSPAVGIVATEDNIDRIPGAIFRARQHAHDVVITARTEHVDSEALMFARALNATVIEPPKNWTEARGSRDRLAAAAREAGYPGLIYITDLSDPIDLEMSVSRLKASDKFAINAVIAPAVDKELRVLVGIPAYNERQSIRAVVEGARQYADEVLVVDDGSTDGTANRAKAAGATVVKHSENRGYGAAMKTLFTQAQKCRANHLVVVDGDGQHDIDDIPRLIETQQETDAEIVIGCRHGGETSTEMPLYRRFGLGVINFLTNLSLGAIRPSSQVSDTQSGFRAYNRRAIESLASDTTIGHHMHASTDILYHAYRRGFSIEEIPTTMDYTVEGASSHNPVQHGIVLVMNIVRTVSRERPMTILGLPGVVCAVLGLLFSYWAIYDYAQTGSFSAGFALGAAVLVIAGLLASFTAILLHSMALIRNKEQRSLSPPRKAHTGGTKGLKTATDRTDAESDSHIHRPERVD